MEKKLLTTNELAELMKVTTQSIYNWRKQGMPFYKIGKSVRFDLEEIREWLKTKKG